MKASIKYLIMVCMAQILFSCFEAKELPVTKYLSWVNDPKNGLVKIKQTGGYVLKAKFLPKEFLQLRDEKEDTLNSKFYKSTLTFTIGISIDKKIYDKYGGDILMTEIKDYNEYKSRIYNANFNISDKISLEYGGKKVYPVLCSLENTHGMTAGVTFICVFPIHSPDKITDNLELTFQDELFNTGINHFVFSKNDLNDIPKPI